MIGTATRSRRSFCYAQLHLQTFPANVRGKVVELVKPPQKLADLRLLRIGDQIGVVLREEVPTMSSSPLTGFCRVRPSQSRNLLRRSRSV